MCFLCYRMPVTERKEVIPTNIKVGSTVDDAGIVDGYTLQVHCDTLLIIFCQ